ncbi:MAG: prephenate dehydrogenase/arogenate dehydrogenase family protein [Candidatus Promineifilaceae bacterium]|nr:prephenate dehydrogenase/arogenate dehydrogenase family protein [Candidatus Promineifilaceae bacterium]
MKAEAVLIVGLTRTSGSVGLALRAADLGWSISAFDPNEETAERAKELGLVDDLVSDVRKAMDAADLLILDLPPQGLETALTIAGQRLSDHGLVVDLSRPKQMGLELAQQYLARGHYVGASPALAAERLTDAETDLSGARADLFRDSVICLMADESVESEAVRTAVRLGQLLGAKPFFVAAREYDSLTAGTNVAPGLLAAALFKALTAAEGWRDMRRFAGTPFAMGTAGLEDETLARQVLTERAATLRWLDAVRAELDQVRALLIEGDEERLTPILRDLRLQRQAWLEQRKDNVWLDHLDEGVSPLSLRQLLLGGLFSKSDDEPGS